MRTSNVVFALVILNLAACSKFDRKYDPQRRGAPATTDRANSAGKKETAPKSESTPTAAPEEIAVLPEITDRKWCTVREAGFNFVIERYVFESGPKSTTRLEQLIFAPNADPRVRSMPAPPEWTAVKTAAVGQARVEFGVEGLTSDVARATPSFHDQAMLFNKMTDAAAISVSPDSLGDDGAVRVTRPGQPDLVLFDCQNYSDDFVALESEDETRPANAAPEAPTATPAAPVLTPPTLGERGTAAALRGQLTAVEIGPETLPGTRWCSYKTVTDDVIVGLLVIDKSKFTFDHLRASTLKDEKELKTNLQSKLVGRHVHGKITGAKASRFTTSAGPSFRMVRDQIGQRALVLDGLSGDQSPASTAEIFFSCEAEQSPIEDASVLKNIAAAATLVKSLR